MNGNAKTSGGASRAHAAGRHDIPRREAPLRGHVYEHIRGEILAARFARGSSLSEYELAKTIGVSRTPVREALKRLEQEGLVRSISRRGTFVADLGVRDIVEIYQIRIQLEGLAARVAAERMPPAEVDKLMDELKRAEKLARAGRFNGMRAHDIHVHKQIIGSTSNGRLVRILATLDDQVHRIRQRAVTNPARVPMTLREHKLILDAIRKREQASAEKAMRDHLQAARENAIEWALAGTNL